MTERFLNILEGLTANPKQALHIYGEAYSALYVFGLELYPVFRGYDSPLPSYGSQLKREIFENVLLSLISDPDMLDQAVFNLKDPIVYRRVVLNKNQRATFKEALKQYALSDTSTTPQENHD